MQSRLFTVYILANVNRRLYVGITGDLARRILQHKTGTVPGFARRYGITRLVYFESTPRPRDAISREKQIKGWLRYKKVALIEAANPEWEDLAQTWFEPGDSADPSLRSG